MRTTDDLRKLFHARGLRVTPQRQRVFQILAESTNTHPTAELIYAQIHTDMPTVSLKTIYEILNELVDLGEIQMLDLGTGARRFDPTTEPHHHLICDHCGKVRDVFADFSQVEIPPGQRQGFTIRNTEVVLRGTCDQCDAGLPPGANARGDMAHLAHQESNG
jgi:Fe2+ or Zn2+ uptake regulation protein